MRYTGVRKHKRDFFYLSTDELQKPVFENRFTRDKTRFAGNKTRLTRDETRIGREIAKNSGETNSISREMKPVSPEMTSVTGKIKKNLSYVFFRYTPGNK
jgi:hypothetical protein